MNIDLSYSNKEGISLQNILDILITEKAKKDILLELNTTKSIDTLLKKLEESNLVKKTKIGNKVVFSKVEIKGKTPKKTKKQQMLDDQNKMHEQMVERFNPEELTTIEIMKVDVQEKLKNRKPTTTVEKTWIIDDSENDILLGSEILDISMPRTSDEFRDRLGVSEATTSTAPKLNKAQPKMHRSPTEVNKINKQTAIMSKDHQITTLIEMESEKKTKNDSNRKSNEVNQDALELLKKEMEGRTGKEVTAILHKRQDRALKERKESAQEIYEKQQIQIEKDSEVYDEENPFRFALNFFTSTLNGERATPYFRRRDDYVVKSIYNKFKTLCNAMDSYILEPQNLPFYRVITINETDLTVKIYHIDMNRIVRGSYTIFQLTESDAKYLEFKNK